MKKMNNLITEREIFLKNSAEKRRSARQQSHLDLADLEGLPMPAVADMRARVSKRDSKYKRRKASLARTWKNETKGGLMRNKVAARNVRSIPLLRR